MPEKRDEGIKAFVIISHYLASYAIARHHPSSFKQYFQIHITECLCMIFFSPVFKHNSLHCNSVKNLNSILVMRDIILCQIDYYVFMRGKRMELAIPTSSHQNPRINISAQQLKNLNLFYSDRSKTVGRNQLFEAPSSAENQM